MGEVCVEALAAALDEVRAERDALKAEQIKDREAMLGAGLACQQAHEENDALKAEVAELEETITTQRFDNGKIVAEFQRVRAEVARLRAAARAGEADDA